MTIQEKIPHTYTMSGKELAEKCGFKGVVTGLEAEPYTYKDEDSGKTKNAFRITARTMERQPDEQD